MSSSRSAFVRHVHLYPRRYLPDAPQGVHLERQVDSRPARFAIGLDMKDPKAEWLKGAPMHLSHYLGRVDDICANGAVSATVWECPNGTEALTTLNVEEHFDGARPQPGDLLRIWSWIEIVDGREHPRVRVERETRVLDEQEREQLRALVAAWEQEMKGGGE